MLDEHTHTPIHTRTHIRTHTPLLSSESLSNSAFSHHQTSKALLLMKAEAFTHIYIPPVLINPDHELNSFRLNFKRTNHSKY